MALRTLTLALADVRAHLDESTARQWSDAELTRWLNEAARDVSRRAEVLQATSTTAVVIGTRTYALTAAMLRLHRLEWAPTVGGVTMPVEYMDFNDLDARVLGAPTRSGDPMFYTLWGFPPTLTLHVYPVPAAAGSLITYHYRESTDAVNGAEPIEIPEGWFDLATQYCEAMAKRKDGDPTWQESDGLYERRLGELIRVSRRWTDAGNATQLTRVPNIVPPTERFIGNGQSIQAQG